MAKKIISFMAAMVVSLMLVCGASASDKVYVNGIDFGFPPFGFVDKDGEPTGFDVEAVNWIAEKMGFEVKHQPMDWDGIIPALNAGKIDFIASGMSATAERAKIVNFTIPYYSVTQVMVVRGDEEMDIDEFLKSGRKIGVQRGTNTAKILTEIQSKPGMNFELVNYDSTDLSLQDLPIGRIDASGMDSSIANELLKDSPFKIGGTFDWAPENYGYAVRKTDPELLETLNRGLKLLMADPYWEQLKEKWDIH